MNATATIPDRPCDHPQYMRALKRAPANGWSYYGLSQVYKARGDASAAGQAEAELAKTWIGDRAILQLGNL